MLIDEEVSISEYELNKLLRRGRLCGIELLAQTATNSALVCISGTTQHIMVVCREVEDVPYKGPAPEAEEISEAPLEDFYSPFEVPNTFMYKDVVVEVLDQFGDGSVLVEPLEGLGFFSSRWLISKEELQFIL